MRESNGKRVARELFYRECLPEWLSEEQLRSSNFLVLLGDEPREIPLLDELGVPRRNIWSIEREYPIYCRQNEQGLGVSLRCGDMADFLERQLHSNQGFSVLNLDVEGSYINQLDPAMTSVLLFCWRNPQTVVATYSSVGRDARMLMEGMRSLATLLWLAPDATQEFVMNLTSRYAEAGFTEPFRMVFRDLFWLRSVLENAFAASVSVGASRHQSVERFLLAEKIIWESVLKRRCRPLRFHLLEKSVLDTISERSFISQTNLRSIPHIGVGIGDMRHVVYNAKRPWSQLCHFVRFEIRDNPLRVSDWIVEATRSFITRPLIYINRRGRKIFIDKKPLTSFIPARTVVCPNRDFLRFSPRQLKVGTLSPDLADLRRTITVLRKNRRNGSKLLQKKTRKEDEAMTKNGKRRRPNFMRGDELTDYGRDTLRKLAGRGLTTEEIEKRVPSSVPRSSIVAFRAIANRPK